MKIKSQLFISFLLLIVIFFVAFFVNQRLSNQVVHNSTYLNNSETVIRNSNVLQKNMIEMQSGFRGYLLTGQESFLQPYYDGLKDIPTIKKEQLALISSRQQKQRLDSIMLLHGRWILYANSLISTRKDTLPEAGKKYRELFENKLKTEVGKKLNDEIQLKFNVFDATEYQLRQKRRTALQQSIRSTRNITLGLTIFSITIALITCFYIVRIITSRINKMVILAEEISEGNFKKIDDDKQDELTKLSESLNTMSETLEKNFKELTKKNKELDQFAYVVSHDLKAPLRGIDNITKWMEEDHSTEFTIGVKKNIDLIKGRTKRLEGMINGLLEYARIGRVKKDFEEVHVETMLRDLVDLLVPPSFIVVIQHMPVLITERLRLEQVFSNLLENAVKYHHRQGGKINIYCREIMGFYEFSVSDDGPGIQQEYHEKIFMIFQTLKERDAFESTGVGLAIVKKIIEEQKAAIYVESELGKGTTFKFTWPKTTTLN
jgi:signal transduction histidine kinase